MAGLAVLTGSQQAQGKHGKECRGTRLMVATAEVPQLPSRVDKNGVERVLPQPRTPKPQIVDRLEFPGIVVADCGRPLRLAPAARPGQMLRNGFARDHGCRPGLRR